MSEISTSSLSSWFLSIDTFVRELLQADEPCKLISPTIGSRLLYSVTTRNDGIDEDKNTAELEHYRKFYVSADHRYTDTFPARVLKKGEDGIIPVFSYFGVDKEPVILSRQRMHDGPMISLCIKYNYIINSLGGKKQSHERKIELGVYTREEIKNMEKRNGVISRLRSLFKSARQKVHIVLTNVSSPRGTTVACDQHVEKMFGALELRSLSLVDVI